jgi:hypothetical protein
MRGRAGRHRALRDARVREVAVLADEDSVRVAEVVTALLIKRCLTLLTERCGCS